MPPIWYDYCFILAGFGQQGYQPGYNEGTPGHIKVAVAAGILIPLLCMMYMCCISAILLCREHYLAIKYDEFDKRRLVILLDIILL